MALNKFKFLWLHFNLIMFFRFKKFFIVQFLLVSSISYSSANQGFQNINFPAHFTVTTEVVNQNVQPFTATIGGFGNSLITRGSGFEPIVFRNQYIASEGAPDRVVAKPSQISHWDTLREGALDGAKVFVYRIVNGEFKLVREDYIAKRGFHASGWIPLIKKNKILPSNVTQYEFRWNNYNRPNVKYFFTVRAVNFKGNLSKYAPVFSVNRPEKVGQGKPRNYLQKYKFTKPISRDNFFSAPKNFRGEIKKNGLIVLKWDPIKSKNVAGYIVYRSDYPTNKHEGYYFQLKNKPSSRHEHIVAGDMVIVSKKFYSASRKRYHSNRVWGANQETKLLMPGLIDFFPDEDTKRSWELVRHHSTTLVDEPGETYLRLKFNTKETVSIGMYNHSGIDQSWYDVLEKKPYTVEVWLRKKGSGKVRFRMPGVYEKNSIRILPIEFEPDSKWKKFIATFRPTFIQSGKRPNRMVLEFEGRGTFDVDNFRVYRADTAYLDYTPEEYKAIKDSGMMALRTHGTIKTGRKTYNMAQITNSGGVISSTKKLNTLPQTLKMMKKAGVQPWLQIEPHMSPNEWRAFVEYMVAPYEPKADSPFDKPWAYKRYRQGQFVPWIDEFDQIYFELGNETWNRLFQPWVFNSMTDQVTGKKYRAGRVYGLYQEYVRSIMRSSPYWRDELDKKWVFMLGGWSGQNYGRHAASTSTSSDYLTFAAYNGGWDEEEGPAQLNLHSFFNVLNQVSQGAIPSAKRHLNEIQSLKFKNEMNGISSFLRIGTYEAGPGYELNGLNRAKVSKLQAEEQEKVMKSLAAGTATLDSFLARAYYGYSIQNYFTFGKGTYWKSHAKWYNGAQAYPSWQLLSLFNNEGVGDILRTKTISVSSVDLYAFKRRKAVKNAPLVAVYATRLDDRVNVFVMSRKLAGYPVSSNDGFTPVIIDLPFNDAKSVALHKMIGSHSANNIYSKEAKIEKIKLSELVFNSRFSLNEMTGVDSRGLPPASTLLYVFEGVSGEI